MVREEYELDTRSQWFESQGGSKRFTSKKTNLVRSEVRSQYIGSPGSNQWRRRSFGKDPGGGLGKPNPW